jgi:hypothetical protein
MAAEQDRYFVQYSGNDPWQEVTKDGYVDAERGAGFYNTLGRPDQPATASFGNGRISGRLCYGGRHLPEEFIPLEGEPAAEPQARPGSESSVGHDKTLRGGLVDQMMTPQDFHAELVKKFNEHSEKARKGEVEPFSFLEEDGIEYNGWIEHRHGWAITEDLLCGVALSSLDDLEDPNSGLEVPFEECGTCSRLVDMYRDYCSKYRIEREASRKEMRKTEKR